MDYLTPLGIVVLAGLIHASFQLGVSMMTLLSGHALGSKRSARRVLGLITAFFGGALVMTMLSISLLAYLITLIWPQDLPMFTWTVSAGLLMGLGVVVWIAYYRPRGRGTELWLPRSMARFLHDRTCATRDAAEAFSLGLSSVLAEFAFMLPLSFVAALAITMLPSEWQVSGLVLYTLIASLGLALVVALIGSGRRISTIQRWRETHKRFLQFAAGGGFIVLGFFVYVTYVVVPSMLAGNL